MDNEAMTSTFSRLRQRLLGMAQRITGNSDDAADAVQDAFTRLWMRRLQLPDEAAEGTAVVAVRNACLDSVRRRNSRRSVPLDDAAGTAASGPATQCDERAEAYRQVRAIIDTRLTESQRRVLVMRDFEGRSFDEIAQTLGISPDSARMQLSRARKAVRECYRQRTLND